MRKFNILTEDFVPLTANIAASIKSSTNDLGLAIDPLLSDIRDLKVGIDSQGASALNPSMIEFNIRHPFKDNVDRFVSKSEDIITKIDGLEQIPMKKAADICVANKYFDKDKSGSLQSYEVGDEVADLKDVSKFFGGLDNINIGKNSVIIHINDAGRAAVKKNIIGISDVLKEEFTKIDGYMDKGSSNDITRAFVREFTANRILEALESEGVLSILKIDRAE